MEQNITSNEIQQVLDSILFNVLGKFANSINSDSRLNRLIKQIYGGALTYANGLKVLAREPESGIWYQYDSMLPICRAFLEQYPVICKLIELFPDVDLYDDYMRYLVVEEYIQDRALYNSIKNDPTIESEAKRKEALNIHINNWIEGIEAFFPDEAVNINKNNKVGSLKAIISKLENEYANKYEPNNDVGMNNFIGKALQNNIAYKEYFGFEFRDSFQIYRFLCDETHSNFGAINSRTRFNGYISINESNKQNGEAAIFTIIWCIKDIELKLDSLLNSITELMK